MAGEQSKSAVLKTMKDELHKTKFFYDVNGRTTHIAQARIDAVTGDVCLLTQYTFTGTSTSPDASSEREYVWDSLWDVDETDPA